MMTDEELNDLAADIKANGLIHPIVLDKDGQLVDGRNRLEGCKRANVPATFRELPEGQDPIAFILSANVNRRHLSKGQAAMATARARRHTDEKFISSRKAAQLAGVDQAYVVRADSVLDHAPELADSVLSGATTLQDAYEVAQQRKTRKKQQDDEAVAAAAKAEAEARERQKKLDRLQQEAPDIAALVQEERLSLSEALSAMEERKRAYARELNCARRQMDTEKKKKIAADQLREDPRMSNRRIGRMVGLDDKTVGALREKLISLAEIPQVDTVVTEDGKERPAEQPKPRKHEWMHAAGWQDWHKLEAMSYLKGMDDETPIGSLSRPEPQDSSRSALVVNLRGRQKVAFLARRRSRPH